MFTWSDDFSVQIPIIDEQHKKLFEIGNNIYYLYNHFQYDELTTHIKDLLGELERYTKYHFRTEEDLMIRFHYPDISEHIKEHRKFIDYLDSIDLYENTYDQAEYILGLLQFISSWIFKHINYSDFKYSDFLVKAIEQEGNL